MASAEQIAAATPAQAVAHPKWRMGAKISVDSATLMNKGLELIEAHYLFRLTSDRIDIVIHPQSTVHSLVEFVDGSVLAQLGAPDMRIPIAYALAWPERVSALVQITPAYDGRPREDDGDLAEWDRLADGLERGGVDGFLEAYDPKASDEFRDTVMTVTRQRLERHRDLHAVAAALCHITRLMRRGFAGISYST